MGVTVPAASAESALKSCRRFPRHGKQHTHATNYTAIKHQTKRCIKLTGTYLGPALGLAFDQLRSGRKNAECERMRCAHTFITRKRTHTRMLARKHSAGSVRSDFRAPESQRLVLRVSHT
jgi:hypothetical protein